MRPKKPKTLAYWGIDTDRLISAAKGYIEFLWDPAFPNLIAEMEPNVKEKIFKEVIEVVYGPKIWDRIKELKNDNS